MTITPAVQRQFFDEESKQLIYLPSRQASSPAMIESIAAMSISSARPTVAVPDMGASVSFYRSPAASPATESHGDDRAQAPVSSPPRAQSTSGSAWTEEEHARFLLGLDMFPSGPWKAIARCVGTRTARQTMSHAQKYRQKIGRRQRQRERQRQRLGLVLGARALANRSSGDALAQPLALASLSVGSQLEPSLGPLDPPALVDAIPTSTSPMTATGSSSSGSEAEMDVAEKQFALMGGESPLLLLTDDALAEFMGP